jgi:transcriptional regulator with XRE-family HTH domain
MKRIRGLDPATSLTDMFPDLAEVAVDRRGLAELASALVQLRSRTGLKQSELAQSAGVPTSLISELENARNDGVSWRTVVRLVKGAGARIDLLFSIDPVNAGAVNITVAGDYVALDGIDADEVATFINERNDATPSKLTA